MKVNKLKALIVKLLRIPPVLVLAFLFLIGWVLTQIGKGRHQASSQVRQRARDLQKEFLELLPNAARLHPLTWCVKHQKAVWTSQLWALRCWECPEFVLNSGICDPL